MSNGGPTIVLDSSQSEFCKSPVQNTRLLAPAGCGKTESLLHRCRELIQRASGKPRFLIVTFTRNAAEELKDRVEHDSYFEPVKGHVNITTLNAWGWSRIRNVSRVSNPRLLTTSTDLYFAMRNQLRPVWMDNKHIAPIATKPGRAATNLMTVMDNLKSMGFVHVRDTNRSLYQSHLEALTKQGLAWRIDEQFELLTTLGVLDRPKRNTDHLSAKFCQLKARLRMVSVTRKSVLVDITEIGLSVGIQKGHQPAAGTSTTGSSLSGGRPRHDCLKSLHLRLKIKNTGTTWI